MATSLLAFTGLILGFSGIASVQSSLNAARNSSFAITSAATGTSWWNIFLSMPLVLGIPASVFIRKGLLDGYRLVVLSMLVLCMSYTTSEFASARSQVVSLAASLASLPNTNSAAAEDVRSLYSRLTVYMVGLLLLAMAFFSWILVFGSDEGTAISRLLGSDASTAAAAAFPTQQQPQQQAPRQLVSEQKLSTATTEMSTVNSVPRQVVVANPAIRNLKTESIATSNRDSVQSMDSEINLKARALYGYQANAEDPNEVSFEKGEIFDVIDNKGKWWQVRQNDGRVGIAPSNYVQLL
jgi:glucan phosphoethanolaminetransferase (alkaline phosphatase superfamily)